MCALLLSTSLLAACIGLTSPPDEGASCQSPADCQDLCSPIGECVLRSSANDIRIRWTVAGVEPSVNAPAPCQGIDALEVRFEPDSLRDESVAFFPVPCENGSVFYPAMPPRFVQVVLTSVDSSGQAISQAIGTVVADAEMQLDLPR